MTLEIHLWLILAIMGTHLIGDFFLQSHWMSVNKSKRMDALLIHIGIYTLSLLWLGPVYAVANGAMHLGVDFVTSRITAALWKSQKIHWFFVVIGVDQFLHQVCLLSTTHWCNF